VFETLSKRTGPRINSRHCDTSVSTLINEAKIRLTKIGHKGTPYDVAGTRKKLT
jgi:hypothetical protein